MRCSSSARTAVASRVMRSNISCFAAATRIFTRYRRARFGLVEARASRSAPDLMRRRRTRGAVGEPPGSQSRTRKGQGIFLGILSRAQGAAVEERRRPLLEGTAFLWWTVRAPRSWRWRRRTRTGPSIRSCQSCANPAVCRNAGPLSAAAISLRAPRRVRIGTGS